MNDTGQLQDAAVLVPIFRNGDGRLTLLLVRRTNFGVHGGQLAFPGGKRETDDPDLLHTALREAREEVGIEESTVDFIAELPVVDTVTTGFRIYPFLGRIPSSDEWWFDPREIAEVFEVAVDDLADPGAYGESVESFPQLPEPVRISFYMVESHRLWGASYRIVSPLLPRLLNGEWDL